MLNVSKTELVLFTLPKKQLDSDLGIELIWKRLCKTDSVKYLGIYDDKNLTWKQQINHVAIKLNKANAMLSKLRHTLDKKNSEVGYDAIFKSHLRYASLVWAQNISSEFKDFIIKRLYLLQKKFLKIIFFQSRNVHTGLLFKDFKILRSFDKTGLEDCIFI